jgi:hypothetical protein
VPSHEGCRLEPGGAGGTGATWREWVSLRFGHLNLPFESAGARSILWVMDMLASKGWMVKGVTAGHSGGAPVEQFYAAGYYRMNDAEREVTEASYGQRCSGQTHYSSKGTFG